MQTGIIIPCFNQSAFTRICLASLQLADLDGAEIIVVDNGSADDTPEVLAAWSAQGPGRRVIRNATNTGFAPACNQGARATSAEVLVFLNNDTFVMRDWLTKLLAPLLDPGVVIVGCKLLYPDGTIQHAGVAYGPEGPQHVFAGLAGDHPAVNSAREWQAVTAASMAIRRADFEAIAGFDESFHNSHEDVDLCFRARADGRRVVYTPEAVAYHFESVTEGRLGGHEVENHILFETRWAGRFERDLEREEGQVDMSARVKPKWILRLEEAGVLESKRTQIAELKAQLFEREVEVGRLSRAVSLRSVRWALALQRILRRVIPPPRVK